MSEANAKPDLYLSFRTAVGAVNERWLAEQCDCGVGTIRLWKRGTHLPTWAVQREVLKVLETVGVRTVVRQKP